MRHDFKDFLRHGGGGQFLLARRQGQLVGQHIALSRKTASADHTAARAAFAERLDEIDAENVLRIVNALTPPDTAPTLTLGDLRDVSDAKAETLRQWEARLDGIREAYRTHPQRQRPLRQAMEDRLARAFAGLVNQLRQTDLGITRYRWTTQGDEKVRAGHAARSGMVFNWGETPSGGHPGQEVNCRCWAEPIGSTSFLEQRLVQFAPTDEGYPLQDLLEHEARGGHTISLHVGKTNEFLLASVTPPRAFTLMGTQYRRRHGSFPSVRSAERLTNSNLAQNAEIVNLVANGTLRRAFITSEFNSATGTEAVRTTERAASPIVLRTTFGVGTVIEHAPDMPNGFIIITSYPRNE